MSVAGAELQFETIFALHEIELGAALVHGTLDVEQHQLFAGGVFLVIWQVGDMVKAVVTPVPDSDLECDGHLVKAQP